MPTQRSVLSADYIDSEEAARILGVRVDYLTRLISLGALVPSGYIGRSRVYRRSEVLEYRRTHPQLGTRLK